MAMKQNTIVFLEIGSSKTLVAIMLLRSYAYLFGRKPSPFIVVFLVPRVVLVSQVWQLLPPSLSLHALVVEYLENLNFTCLMQIYDI
jgi:ERCC4-related helicase